MQILKLTLKIEKPELESRLVELTSQVEQMKLKLDYTEESLLQALVSSEKSLLNNVDLLDSLNKSKESAEIIANSLAEADILRKQFIKVLCPY
ncbi:unnamed protein product [Thelazia callipaeda]|uniref:AAA_9 domain-containing protein n=1 Tax=Thelazia callipaeda TaxID=103827 RepID=A0A0N5CQ08_THECL|nr:unnamed protein product [Thelazia callipaeda]